MVERKAFLGNQSINIMYPNVENMIELPITKRIEIIKSSQVCLISEMNINSKENGGKKSFACKSMHQYRVSQCREHDCSAHNEKNRHYNEYPSLFYFMDECYL